MNAFRRRVFRNGTKRTLLYSQCLLTAAVVYLVRVDALGFEGRSYPRLLSQPLVNAVVFMGATMSIVGPLALERPHRPRRALTVGAVICSVVLGLITWTALVYLFA